VVGAGELSEVYRKQYQGICDSQQNLNVGYSAVSHPGRDKSQPLQQHPPSAEANSGQVSKNIDQPIQLSTAES
jgi:hypothetical protein